MPIGTTFKGSMPRQAFVIKLREWYSKTRVILKLKAITHY